MPWTSTSAIMLICLASLGCSRSRVAEYPMTWGVLSEPEQIVLTFVDFPNHYLDITSADLLSYLDGLSDDRVTVRLELTTRLGCLEHIRLVGIDDRRDWSRLWGGSGWVNHEQPSPWDELRCRIPWW